MYFIKIHTNSGLNFVCLGLKSKQSLWQTVLYSQSLRFPSSHKLTFSAKIRTEREHLLPDSLWTSYFILLFSLFLFTSVSIDTHTSNGAMLLQASIDTDPQTPTPDPLANRTAVPWMQGSWRHCLLSCRPKAGLSQCFFLMPCRGFLFIFLLWFCLLS